MKAKLCSSALVKMVFGGLLRDPGASAKGGLALRSWSRADARDPAAQLPCG